MNDKLFYFVQSNVRYLWYNFDFQVFYNFLDRYEILDIKFFFFFGFFFGFFLGFFFFMYSGVNTSSIYHCVLEVLDLLNNVIKRLFRAFCTIIVVCGIGLVIGLARLIFYDIIYRGFWKLLYKFFKWLEEKLFGKKKKIVTNKEPSAESEKKKEDKGKEDKGKEDKGKEDKGKEDKRKD